MATPLQSETSDTSSGSFDLPTVEQTTERVRGLNERLIASSKNAGFVTLDGYEKVLQSLAGFEEKLAAASHVDWVSNLATRHAKFICDVSAFYTTAARDLLK